MPIMSFEFSGWCRADITTVFDGEKDIDVSNMPASELAKKLNDGTYVIPFADVYSNAGSVENEINGFVSLDD
jgi:hypothetical protein